MPSTAIAGIEYDKAAERLTVTFATGRVYQYVDVPAEVAASVSVGLFKKHFFQRLHSRSL
jgi:hypothetical protein